MVRRGSTVRVRQRASRKALQMGICCCLPRRNLRASRVRDGYILGLAGTRGHARRLAAQPETCSRHSIASTHPKSSCKAEVGVACSDATLTPSFAREGIGCPVARRRAPRTPSTSAHVAPDSHATCAQRLVEERSWGRPRSPQPGCEASVTSTTGSSAVPRASVHKPAITHSRVGRRLDRRRAASADWRMTGARPPVCRHAHRVSAS